MAATSLWHIEGCLKGPVDYVENPEKITPSEALQGFSDVFSYMRNPEKTNDGEYVTTINCLEEAALQQMILTKRQYQKTDGYIAWHGCQSFKPDEVTPDQCHEVGLKLVREVWSDKYQIIGATHLDKRHQHNYFCSNSVSPIDGQKYNYSESEQKRLRDVPDRLHSGYGLSVVEHPKKAPSGPLMKEELRKLDEITAQVRHMSEHHISTHSDLHADRDSNQMETDGLIDYRRQLQNKMCRALPAEKEKFREEKQSVTEQMTKPRERLKYAAAIKKHSAHIDSCLDRIHNTLENQRSNPSARAGRTDRRREGALR